MENIYIVICTIEEVEKRPLAEKWLVSFRIGIEQKLDKI